MREFGTEEKVIDEKLQGSATLLDRKEITPNGKKLSLESYGCSF